MWQVKHLNGLTLVSTTISTRLEGDFAPWFDLDSKGTKDRERGKRTGKDMPFQMFVPGKGLTAIGTEDHFEIEFREYL